jgi:hypothetical protein
MLWKNANIRAQVLGHFGVGTWKQGLEEKIRKEELEPRPAGASDLGQQGRRPMAPESDG